MSVAVGSALALFFFATRCNPPAPNDAPAPLTRAQDDTLCVMSDSLRLAAFEAFRRQDHEAADALARKSEAVARQGGCGPLAIAKARVEIARAIRLGDPINGAYRAIDTLQRYIAETNSGTAEHGLIAMHIGFDYLKSRAYHNARPYYESAANIQQSGLIVHKNPGANIYKPLAAIYTMIGDIQKAQQLLDLAEEACLAADDTLNLAKTYYDMGLANLTIRDPQNAATSLDKALSLAAATDPPTDPYLHSQILSALAETYLMLKDAGNAERYALRALDSDDLNADAALILSQIAAEAGNLKDALHWNAEACEMLSEDDTGPASLINRELAKAKVDRAKLLADTDIRSGLALCAEALHIVLPDYPPSSPMANPAPGNIYPENTILEALETKADLLWRLYLRERRPALLALADSAAILALNAHDTLSALFGFESATLYSQEELRDLHELSLKILYERARLADYADTHIGDRIFRFMEKSRAVLLRQKLACMYLLRTGGPENPHMLLETSLREQISDLRTQLAQLEAEGLARQEAARPLKARLFRLEDQRNQLLRDLAKRRSNTLSPLDMALNEAPKSLLRRIDPHDETHLVAYFYNAQSGDLYLYALGPDSWKIATAHLPYERIEDFLKIVKNGPLQEARESDPAFLQDFATQSRALYLRLLGPLFGDAPPARLLLLPDGSIGDLPFDLLLSETPAAPLDFRQAPYLLRQSVTRLAPSVSALLMPLPVSPSPNRYGYLGFSPGYGASPSLAPVRHGERAVKDLARSFGGRYAVRNAATLKEFCRLAPQASIIHFYGHGKSNYAKPEYSWLAFADDGNSEYSAADFEKQGLLSSRAADQERFIPQGERFQRFVFAYQLGLLQLNADMVMLSACETGVGRIYGGEGAQSLARAFMDAGCRSVCMTLWPVDDAATASLSKKLLENIRKGMRKDEALRMAKLAFVERELSAAPYLWAGFVLTGSDAPVESFAQSWHLPWGDAGLSAQAVFAAGAALVLLAIALWMRKRRRARGMGAG